MRLLDTEEIEESRVRLWSNIRTLGNAAGLRDFPSAIVPFVLGAEEAALAAANELMGQGTWVGAVRYTTVARGQARLCCNACSPT